jgi:hypothetical protein
MADDSPESRESPPAEEIPHARGPSVLGVEDMGLQDGRGLQITLSNPNLDQDGAGSDDTAGEATRDGEFKPKDDDADGDGDIFLGDASAKTNDDQSNSGAEKSAEADTAIDI